MATFWSKALLGVTSFAFMACAARAQIVNGGFDLPDGSQPELAVSVGSGYITGWLAVPGTDGTFSGGLEYCHDRSQDPGGYSVELGAYYGATGIQQTFPTVPNADYQMTFWLASDPFNGTAPGRLRVSAGGLALDFTAPPGTGDATAAGWQPETFSFTSDGSGQTTLLLQNYPDPTNSISPPMIDTASITAVPEVSPAFMAAMGGVVVGLRALRWPSSDR